MAKISVLMGVYNKSARLKESINSVLNQSFKDFELILINDGSSDHSGEICDIFAKKESRIKVYHQSNKGVSYTRNRAINLSNSEFISFLDADDTYESDFLEKMIKKINISDSDVCYCGHNYVSSRKTKARFNFKTGSILVDYLKNKCTPNTNSWLIRKAFIFKHNIKFQEDLNFGEDMLFFSEILLNSKNTVCVNEYLTNYFLNITNSLSENSIEKITLDLLWLNLLKEKVILNPNIHFSLKKKLY